ncbi:hypothetical protein PF004_g29905 [Phytophthora fragariae]|uniref:Uncharacterized protein n=1 Tax=Phytophthora fragariae TaxID=53985 RepID=A0A6G0MF59_9STRA|nr:hypothetical protein PF004_g29905 [Phytophthora fragariae]
MVAAGMGDSSTAGIAAAGTAKAAWQDGEHGGGTGNRRAAFREPQRHGERSGSGDSESSMTSMAAAGMEKSSTASIAAARVRISSLVAALAATVDASRATA